MLNRLVVRLRCYKVGDVNQSRKNALAESFTNAVQRLISCVRYESSRQDKERELIVYLRPISPYSKPLGLLNMPKI